VGPNVGVSGRLVGCSEGSYVGLFVGAALGIVGQDEG
jgi:hypothetical protein